ncbi:dihydrofolate reductase isoform X1 [Apis mellifera caucasica]|uniref:dihydrofolate reductase n=1 Tax=Apis mellifera TaxID=7460 RepID=A0A7M7R4Q9_APIME|nr:dihydrofolate reductase isoform X1 [Apis mellifera]KAG6797474.1 dihydrofolate reductase isoform X1 [Apis mellifera caucasica]KAG9428883.1 dihydrofolate reductase isoform X1 [Apis mellifera carnica]|eukprot:XP_393902.1 dihydrofolate reductase isoform X1 [Apis mellifera]
MNLHLIAATCEGMGIGIKGTLPWKLKSELAFFTYMTTNTKNPNKRNVVLMGRRTWESIPKENRPLKNRINIVLTSQSLDYGNDVIVCKNIPHAFEVIEKIKDRIENIWVTGGSSVYKEAMESPNFYRLYLTRIKKYFECDTFFPTIPNDFVLTEDPNIPQGIQEENDIQFVYEVYKKE